MKIVIDIPEETYRRIQALIDIDYFEHDICGYLMRRIVNGSPLPKGYGRLIDADNLKNNMEFICMDIMAGTGTYNAPLIEIDNAPTIIEADKETENE